MIQPQLRTDSPDPIRGVLRTDMRMHSSHRGYGWRCNINHFAEIGHWLNSISHVEYSLIV